MDSHERSKLLRDFIGASRPAILRRTQKMLRGQNQAEDAAQDAIVAALSHVDSFRGDSKMGTWLYRVGTNAVLMNLRHDKRMADRIRRAGAESAFESQWLHGGYSSPPQKLVENAEQHAILRSAVQRLPDRYRQVVIMCDFAELPMDEVAKKLGITIGGVRTRRLRAHRILKNDLAQQSVESSPS